MPLGVAKGRISQLRGGWPARAGRGVDSNCRGSLNRPGREGREVWGPALGREEPARGRDQVLAEWGKDLEEPVPAVSVRAASARASEALSWRTGYPQQLPAIPSARIDQI